jgi:hypothetical protein
MILNVTVFDVSFWRKQYREKLILNVTVFVVRVWEGNIENNCNVGTVMVMWEL